MKNRNETDNSVEVLSVETNAPARSPRRGLLWLAVLLLTVLAGAGGAYLWQNQQALRVQLDMVESRAAVAAPVTEDPRVAGALHVMQSADQEIAALNARVTQLDAEQNATQATLDRFGTADKRDWALAEAEYLIRLASQSLLMGREVHGAIALLDAADEVLRAQADPALHEARAALARDRASLRALAEFDVEGIYLRLAALGDELPALVIEERSLAAARGERGLAAPVPAESDGWTRIRAVLDRYIVVRQRSQPAKPLLPLADEQYLRANQRLALEQAKLALLAAEPAIYRGALNEAAALTRAYFNPDIAANRAFLAELERLSQVDIAPELPDISDALRALRERVRPVTVPDEG